MVITKRMLNPSRPDAERLRRNEKFAMLHLMYAVTILDDLGSDMHDRLGMVENGHERILELKEKAEKLLDDLRVTVPENQRIGMQNTAKDYEMRLTPSATPSETNVIMAREEFRTLVDSAREKCRECVQDDAECEGCGLYRLLTSIVPLDEYHSLNLCPYNLGRWKN